ncbi:MAG: SUMF1/EgtB/PvdO family nonheme iron enzyme [Planctomycetaceae bacterium]|nr:SUMF1/EgtB/PvdO family nonheme iron enzyme [Planctomycetales bacterium]MCB9926850.1 SUMF1/EgtB/PvdO family nonheme iron enzyme [Planctomycetaceae bacterium]
MNEQDIFIAAMDREDPAERQQFLDEACAGDVPLRMRVEHLIQQSGSVGSFLEHPPVAADDDAWRGFDATIVHSNGSTCDDEDDLLSSEQLDMTQNPHDSNYEIPLGYLQPATREDSLGRLGHYDVLNVVGKGAFGTVLRAFDTKLERIVAIKVLALEMASMSPARKRFLREARTSAQIRHENIVGIHSVEEEPIPYLVMEYIPGKTLQQQLEEHGPLDLLSVLRLGKQIADGLAAAHAQDLIHRDIKPGNILLEGGMEERIKITDFGLARTADDASMTQSGMIAGTPMYMAPEQAHGRKLDQRADLFSFGSVLYQMVSGRPPFRASNTVAVLKRVVEDTPRPIQEIIPEVPDWMCELIGHLHAKNPDERYQSAREVSELLAYCAKELEAGRVPQIPNPSKAGQEHEAESVAIATTQREPSRQHSRRTKVAVAAIALLVLLGITEMTGVTQLASTIIRLTTGSGTLVIETDDPDVTIAINGEAVTIRGGGIDELTLRPGQYRVETIKDGETVQQELVSITRGGRSTIRITLESSPVAATVEGIDLIQLLDPARDFRDDRLKIQDGKLITPQFKNPGAIGMIPYGPVPDEYDIQLRLQRLSNHFAGFNFGIVVGGRQVCVGMDSGMKEKVWGLDFLDGKAAHRSENPTRNEGRKLIVGKTSDVTIQVRKNHVTASCDGEQLIDWTGDPERLSVYSGFEVTDSGSLFFVAQADFIVHSMTLIPRSESASVEDRSATVAAPPQAKAPFAEGEAKRLQQAWADYLGVPVEKEIVLGQDKDGKDVTLTMVLIPPGEFMIGATDEEQGKWLSVAKAANPNASDDKFTTIYMEDQRFVRITKPFWIARTEFTKEQFRRFVEGSGGYRTDAETNGIGGFRYSYSTRSVLREPELNWDNWDKVENVGHDQNPVVNVSWNDAAKCCEWLSSQYPDKVFSLPTEAQWEFACRAGTKNSLYDCETSEQLREYAQFGDEVHFIQRCGQLRPNAFGLYDTLGNVTEWCANWLGGYAQSPTDDPAGPAVPGKYVMKAFRGGNFTHPIWRVRSSKRDFDTPDNCFFDRGFRVAATITKDAIPARLTATSAPSTGNHALSFDGKSYVETPVHLETDGPFTIEAWVTPNRWVGSILCSVICNAEQSGASLELGNLDRTEWRFSVHDQNGYQKAKSSDSPERGQQIHLAGVFDGTNARLFVNGELMNEQPSLELPLVPSKLPLMIGANPQVGPKPPAHNFDGIIDEVRLSDAARYSDSFTPAAHFEADEHTLALYHFDEGTGDVLKDSSANGHHGRIVGATWVKVGDAIPHTTAHKWPADAPPPAIAPFDAAQAKKHQEVWAKYLGVPVEYTNSLGMKFRLIPPGEFLMGSTSEEISRAVDEVRHDHWKEHVRSEAPQHRVMLTRPFYLGTTEVTQADFLRMMDRNPSYFTKTGEQKDLADKVGGIDTARHPVEGVYWTDAADFCAKLADQESLAPYYGRSVETITVLGGDGYRLPSEAEWEFACRAGTATRHWTGNRDDDLTPAGWSKLNSDGRTHAVGELNANPFGLFDIHGNVWEWVQDLWVAQAYEPFRAQPAIDPTGSPGIGWHQGFRGGCWADDPVLCRSAYREAFPENDKPFRDQLIGFRIALSVDAVRQTLKVDGPAVQ